MNKSKIKPLVFAVSLMFSVNANAACDASAAGIMSAASSAIGGILTTISTFLQATDLLVYREQQQMNEINYDTLAGVADCSELNDASQRSGAIANTEQAYQKIQAENNRKLQEGKTSVEAVKDSARNRANFCTTEDALAGRFGCSVVGERPMADMSISSILSNPKTVANGGGIANYSIEIDASQTSSYYAAQRYVDNLFVNTTPAALYRATKDVALGKKIETSHG